MKILTFIVTTMVAELAFARREYNTTLNAYEPSVPLVAVRQSDSSRYELTGTYGTNNVAISGGEYAFINQQISDEEIPNGGIVTTWALITKGANERNGRLVASSGTLKTETVECTVQWWKD